MMPEDFVREKNFVSENGYPVNPSSYPKFKRPHLLEKEVNVRRFDDLVPNKNTLTYPETVRKSIHKTKWTEFLKTERLTREKEEDVKEKRKLGRDPALMANDPLSLGLDSRSGMLSPRLELPDPIDPLKFAHVDQNLNQGGFVKPSNRPAYQLEDGTIAMRRFKVRPESVQEERDCNICLHPMDIVKLVCGPPVLDFGSICAMAKMSKRFAVTNKTKKSIHVKLNVDDIAEITADPVEQVVPSGGTAGLGINLCVARVQSGFKQVVTYSVNGEHHTFAFDVAADVVPVNLELSRDSIAFKFNAENWEPYVREMLYVTNTNTYPAEFEFDVPGAAFNLKPMKGIVDAKSAQEVAVEWEPSKIPGGNECVIVLKVAGATQSQQIKCVGENPEGKLQWRENKVDLKDVSVGSANARFVTIKNTGTSDAFYQIEIPKTDKIFHVGVEPMYGRIEAGSSADIEMTFEASEPGSCKLDLMCHVRGGKSVPLTITAEAIVPRVICSADEFNFDQVYLGGNRTLLVKLVNSSGIQAELDLNLKHYGAFSVDLPKENWSQEDYEDCPVMRMAADGSLRTPSSKDPSDAKRVPKDGKEAEGDRYRISVAPKKALTFNLMFRPQVMESYAFELPLELNGYTTSNTSDLAKVVLAEALRPKLVVSSSFLDFGPRICMNERVKKIPYVVEAEFTNNFKEELKWCFGKPGKVEPQGSKGIFTVRHARRPAN
jgi:hypothetical protein